MDLIFSCWLHRALVHLVRQLASKQQQHADVIKRWKLRLCVWNSSVDKIYIIRPEPEDAGSIPSRKALELHFSQLVPVRVL